jgi:hypothetical protein
MRIRSMPISSNSLSRRRAAETFAEAVAKVEVIAAR